MSRYRPARDITPEFLQRVEEWIQAQGEVFVVVRWVGGFRDFALCRSRADFERIVELVCDGTELIVMRERQLPLRGPVTEELIACVLAAVPDGVEFLAMSAEARPGSPLAARICEGCDSHKDLEETLRDWMGREVAVGVCPDFWAADHAGMMSRAKGGIEGPR